MKKVEYIIVGQGFAGTLLSYQLYNRGISHVIFDNSFEKSATKTAAGLMNPIVFKRLTKSWMADEQVEKTRDIYPKIQKLIQKSFFKELPIAKIFANIEEQNDWELKKDNDNFDKYLGYINESEQLGVISPFGRGMLNNSYVVDTDVLLNGWKGFLSEQIEQTKFNYSELIITEKEISYENYQAKGIIFCEGSQYVNNPFFDWLPFKLTKGEILRIKVPNLDLDYTLNKGFFMMPVGKNEYKVGSTYEWEDLSYKATEQGKQALIEKINKVINIPFEIIEHKAGVRPTVIDRKPIVGSHPVHKNIFVFNGLGTKGGLIAPWLSGVFVKFLLENKKLPDEIFVERFRSNFK